MSIHENIPVPFRYVDSVSQKQHILLLYEDPEYARLIEFRFLKNGLDNGENCLYVTDQDSASIVIKFLSYGIPLQEFQSGRLRVIQMHESCGDREQILYQAKKDLVSIMDSLIGPYRVVGRIVPNVGTLDGISAQIELEKKTHQYFEDLCGSIMCTYDLSKIEKTKRKVWMEKLRKTHHAIIHAPRFGQGGVICPYMPN